MKPPFVLLHVTGLPGETQGERELPYSLTRMCISHLLGQCQHQGEHVCGSGLEDQQVGNVLGQGDHPGNTEASEVSDIQRFCGGTLR